MSIFISVLKFHSTIEPEELRTAPAFGTVLEVKPRRQR
jgi:hypothetical protein